MRVRNLVPWAGDRWLYEPGQIVDLDPQTAKARIAAGLAEKVRAGEANPETEQEGDAS